MHIQKPYEKLEKAVAPNISAVQRDFAELRTYVFPQFELHIAMNSLPAPSGRLSQTTSKNLCQALRARRHARQLSVTRAAAATKFEATEVKSPQQAGTHESEKPASSPKDDQQSRC